MRIISGKFKGRTIQVPKNFGGRPTTDFAREGLFNVLNNLIEWDEISVIDLFAGTGAFGIECYSRGAGSIRFVEMAPLHIKFIGQNIRQFEINSAHALRNDVFKYLPKETSKYDLIFADPPFDLPELKTLPDLVFKHELLHEGGIFVLEHGRHDEFSAHPKFLQHRSYSNVHFSFFQEPDSDK